MTRRQRPVVRAIAALMLLGACRANAPAQSAPVWQHQPGTRAAGKDTARLAYHGLDYGSEAYFSPLTVLLNKGYDIFQLRNSPRDVWTYPYAGAWDHAIKGLVDGASPAVRRGGGWSRLARTELLPLSFDADRAGWVPNYSEHLLGGGITMRMLDEWYRDAGVPWPRLSAIVTTYASSILNEMTEARRDTIAGAPGVADLLVFDVGAILLFNWDQPTRFFTRTLLMTDWSNQAAFTFPDRKLQNNGQYFTLKVPVGLDRARLFVRFGLSGQTGVSWRTDAEHHVSIAAGGDTKARFVDPNGHETVAFSRGGGVYYDRNNSLLWSAVLAGGENLATVNVYPGVLGGLGRDLGLWTVYTRRKQLMFGIVHRRALGLGLGYGR